MAAIERGDPKIGYKTIIAKAETITEKPSFKMPFKSKRCLVPANGFFEWKKEGKSKIPYYIFEKNSPLISFAGIYDEWMSPDNNKLFTFTIITMEANKLVRSLHDRMPVIIEKQFKELWLDNKTYNEKELQNLLKPYDSNLMDVFEVSSSVNSPNNNSIECITPLN